MNPSGNRPLSPIEALARIYRLYDDYIDSFPHACRKYCADCCTTNVTLTSLEARFIDEYLDAPQRSALFETMRASMHVPRFQPAMSTNRHAQLCAENREPPEEYIPEAPAVCPLLAERACSIYPVRPFACRCMLSTAACGQTGHAQIDEFTLSVNTLFMQFIEHLDSNGLFGNLIDIWLRLDHQPFLSNGDCQAVPNQPAAVLMVPPGHREKILPLINTLNNILARVV